MKELGLGHNTLGLEKMPVFVDNKGYEKMVCGMYKTKE
jgi:hypothetical protein